MLGKKKIAVVMPAYNAAKTLKKTYRAIPKKIVDKIILVDDCSQDETAKLARKLGISTLVHKKNKGYGANQKTCYKEILKYKPDIIIMIHSDYQYNPKLVTAMASLIAEDVYDVIIGSRILGKGALQGGMPLYKYYANRFLTVVENLMINQKVSEYHTGLRAFSRKVLESIPWRKNSDDFIFDNQVLLQIFYAGFRVGEISCPTRYDKDSSSINFIRSTKYGLEVLLTALKYFMAKNGLMNTGLFKKK